MSKKSRRVRAERRLASKMGNFTSFGGRAPNEKGTLYTKPGSKKLKT